MNFDTDEEIEQWIGADSLEAFRRNAEHGTFAGRRKDNALAYLRRLDARNADVREQHMLKLAQEATEAARDQAKSARSALRVSKTALAVSVAAVLVAILTWCFAK